MFVTHHLSSIHFLINIHLSRFSADTAAPADCEERKHLGTNTPDEKQSPETERKSIAS